MGVIDDLLRLWHHPDKMTETRNQSSLIRAASEVFCLDPSDEERVGRGPLSVPISSAVCH